MAEHRRQQREDIVLGFGTPTPSPAGECFPYLWFQGGGGTHSLAGVGVSQFGRGDRHCGIGRGGGFPDLDKGIDTRHWGTLWAEIKTIYSWCHLGTILLVVYFMLERVGEMEPIELGGGGGRGEGCLKSVLSMIKADWISEQVMLLFSKERGGGDGESIGRTRAWRILFGCCHITQHQR